jgi:F-type H+-transporting ATPase subunit gamma
MAGAKEIRTKIKSIQNTQKITKAMEMVAASKMRKAQNRMRSARPYAGKIREVIGHLAHANPEYKHPYTIVRDVKRVGYIVVSTDRGLCGGLNVNLFRSALNSISEHVDNKVEVDVACIGSKGLSFFKRIGVNIVAEATGIGDSPTLETLLGTVRVMLEAFDNGQIDRLYIVNNEFINTMAQKPIVDAVLPIVVQNPQEEIKYHWDYIYEPDSKEVVDVLLTRYIESLVYQAVVENVASEQASRMVAMKSASDNAGSLIDELQLVYNKARQASITQGISEIVAGAAAV